MYFFNVNFIFTFIFISFHLLHFELCISCWLDLKKEKKRKDKDKSR